MFVPVLHSFTPVHPCSGSSHVFATTSGPRSRNHFYSRHNRSLRCIRSGEQPRSPPVLYVDNKAMLALCREHKLEHRTKHIALRYFLARELQQRGQLRLAYVASEANTADIFTKALAPGDHQRFCTLLACFALLDWSCDLLFYYLYPTHLLVHPFLFLHTNFPSGAVGGRY
ncbi:unnamed protein product [Closterium sp. NIES-53]